MAHANFWLPAEFLDDQDLLMSGKPNYGNTNSPVESVMGSDEEDYLDDLSRKLAQSTLDDDLWKTKPKNRYSKSTKVMAGSPQSTLCGCNQISSPNCHSPPWDLLYAAAGEVARLRMAEEAGSKYYINPPNRPPPKSPNPNLQFHHLQAAKFQQLKQQQMMKQQQYQQFLQHTRNGGGNMAAWPILQQSQPPIGSGMRAVFLGKPNTTKRECSGTGVFLPRQITETRKKRGCSTVLIPDRVVQALNLNLESQSPDYDAEMSYRKSVLMAEQRRQQVDKDLRLPQEWTY